MTQPKVMKRTKKIILGVVGLISVLLSLIAIYLLLLPPIHQMLPECKVDSDCVPEQCCHPTSCVNKEFAPDCTDIMCGKMCKGPIDCGEGRCACKNNRCAVESTYYIDE